MGVNPIPEGYRTVTPYLVVEGAANVLDFVKKASARRRSSAWTGRTERSVTRSSRSATRW